MWKRPKPCIRMEQLVIHQTLPLKIPHPKSTPGSQPHPWVLHCLHCRSSEGTWAMTTVSGGAHPADRFKGPPDAHVTVKHLTPKGILCRGNTHNDRFCRFSRDGVPAWERLWQRGARMGATLTKGRNFSFFSRLSYNISFDMGPIWAIRLVFIQNPMRGGKPQWSCTQKPNPQGVGLNRRVHRTAPGLAAGLASYVSFA